MKEKIKKQMGRMPLIVVPGMVLIVLLGGVWIVVGYNINNMAVMAVGCGHIGFSLYYFFSY